MYRCRNNSGDRIRCRCMFDMQVWDAAIQSLGLEEGEGRRSLEVWNKVDVLDPETRVAVEGEAGRRDDVSVVSTRYPAKA